ncbi:MAG: aldehyde dehydrogenase family protein [Dehalococcoidia bacterium]
MVDNTRFFIGGTWVKAEGCPVRTVVDPATEQPVASVAMGDAAMVDRAVAAARSAFNSYSQTTRAERLALLDRISASFREREADLAAALTAEMGAPKWLAEMMHVPLVPAQIANMRENLERFSFESMRGRTRVLREPIGVCAFVTPWNWPLNMIVGKVIPALSVGCTMVLKPSEYAPSCATIFAEVLQAAGVPSGVFNLVHGDGPGVGALLSAHPDVDLVSITGSTRAGIEVARAAAPTVKRVHQELGGKSPAIVLPTADLKLAVAAVLQLILLNTGQSCAAPSRMLVPAERLDEVRQHILSALATHEAASVQMPLGPVVNETQWTRIQRFITGALEDGSEFIAGGPGRPDGVQRGYYVRPTVVVCSNTRPIAQEEVFGPVLAVIPYRGIEDAIAIANDTPYGLAAYIYGDRVEARAVASRIRAGQVLLNGAMPDLDAPFGGYKHSGNGREWGEYAFHDLLEIKAVTEPDAAA